MSSSRSTSLSRIMILSLSCQTAVVQATWASWLHDSDLGYHGSQRQVASRADHYSHPAFEDADRALSTLEEARLCKREATLKLISTPSCKDLLQETHREDLEIIQDLYAVELSKCEIQSASVKLPLTCQFEMPTSPMEQGLRMSLQSKLRSCLAVLHSKPQWWTSYSNHRRDGYQWCLVMKPGFDYNENVKVWKNVYTALDTSVNAIKESLHGILSWSQQSRQALDELSAFYTRMMDLVQSTAETNVDSLKATFNQAADDIGTRMDGLSDSLTGAELKLKDVQVTTEASRSGLTSIYSQVQILDQAQHSQIQQASIVSSELETLQALAKSAQGNISAEQIAIMNNFLAMKASSEQLGQSFADANDNIHNLNIALSALGSLSGLWNLFRMIVPVVLVGLLNRRYAAFLALFILSYQELTSYISGTSIRTELLQQLISTIYYNNGFLHGLRLVGIAALFWIVMANKSKQVEDTLTEKHAYLQTKSFCEKDTDTHPMASSTQKRLYSRQHPKLILPYYGSQTIHESRYGYGRRSFREGSSPL